MAPKAGDALRIDDIEMILEAVEARSKNFPEEPVAVTLTIVMLNIGDRFSPVECVNGEWSSLKKDVPKGEGLPKCPNGHVLTQGAGLKLGWLANE